MSLRFCATLCLIALSSRPSLAQTTDNVLVPLATPEYQHDWVATTQQLLKQNAHPDLVLLARPNQRISCHLKAASDTSLTCKRALRHAAVYNKDEIATILAPRGSCAVWPLFGLGLAITAGAATGVYLLTSFSLGVMLGAGIPLALLAAELFLGSFWALNLCDEPPHDKVLYQHADTPLSVDLR